MIKWIPIKFRLMTEEEIEEYIAFDEHIDEHPYIYDCLLPEDGQEVLITTPWGVHITTFYEDYGCYFENYEDEGDVIAWAALPEPYEE